MVPVVFVVEWDGHPGEEVERSGVGVVEVVCGFEGVDEDGTATSDLILDTVEELNVGRVCEVPISLISIEEMLKQ